MADEAEAEIPHRGEAVDRTTSTSLTLLSRYIGHDPTPAGFDPLATMPRECWRQRKR